MQTKPIDVARLGTIRCTLAPEPRTTPEGLPRTDRDGNAQWVTGLVIRETERRRTHAIDVVTIVEPRGISEGAEVTVTGLTAIDWAQEGRSGTAWRAETITPAGPAPAPAAAPASGPASAPGRKGGDS
ncbi:hypothetical protein GCM10009801_46610 [Streptomyces albiaxialis]|uniref:Uncharacterized protein n=1 Tax=Streptomyces albiaxialis TaxID=329523 RepID=A0ABN2W7A0_9ACTN